ncbi:hypothetical protein [Prauserella cavernicola]|uniref:Secreted protein n=1 Tax=Prauserella cavernicola TaxID=2800127 RepID=A0A934V282_9PSEU|nr:hypothetical protein [Prauserella cavernicola]MBK1784976.1 hypothetical protein [Prauserella cavernicola]
MRALPLLALLLVAGCGASAGAGPGACTAIGAPAGISVTVAPGSVAGEATAATLETCWAQSCRSSRVMLHPTTEAVDTGCTGDRPEDVCSAEVRETGEKDGFADVPGLPEQQVRVTLTITGADGGELTRQTLDLTPGPVYPNGKDCGVAGPQAQLDVAADGTVRTGT